MPNVVTFDVVNVTRPNDIYKDKRETHTFARGDELPDWVPAEDIARLRELGAIADEAEPVGRADAGFAGPEAQAFPGAFEVLRGNVDAATAAAAGEGVDEAQRDQFVEAVTSATSPLDDSGTGTPASPEATPSPTFAGALGQPLGAPTAVPGSAGGIITDDELDSLNADKVRAYVRSNPDELDRVLERERGRPTPRTSVLALEHPGPAE